MQEFLLLGIDTGGTFTDFVMLSESGTKVHKVLSTPQNPAQAILEGIEAMGLSDQVKSGAVRIVHGSTVATNAVLEGKGVETVYVTNQGFRDTLQIGRQARENLYDLKAVAPPSLAPEDHFLEVDCRMDASGQIVQELSEQSKMALVNEIKRLSPRSIAINLLFSFMNDRHEKELEALFDDDFFVTRSSFVLPEYKEFERGMATWINAWIGPLMGSYLSNLVSHLSPSPLAIMQSSGVTISASQAAKRAVNLLLSGPVGGLSAAGWTGRRIERERLITFDMGGTSTDVSLYDGRMRLTDEGRIARYPVAIPMADIHTLGAGGGSIASIDKGGLLRVGPESAGAFPGPACYGQGGGLPTVTDANLVLGRLLPEAFLGGTMALSTEASRQALSPLAAHLSLSVEETASGIIQLANEHMTQALREISIEQGFNPADFSLVSFGGAGGLHFCELADALGINEVLVPRHAGVYSAFGLLTSPPGRELIRTHRQPLSNISDETLNQHFEHLISDGSAELAAEGCDTHAISSEKSLDLRYVGQSFTLNIPWKERTQLVTSFHSLHETRYGHRLDKEIEMVNLRVSMKVTESDTDRLLGSLDAKTASDQLKFDTIQDLRKTSVLYGYENPIPIYLRHEFVTGSEPAGPCLVIEDHATHFIREGWAGSLDNSGNLLFTRYDKPI